MCLFMRGSGAVEMCEVTRVREVLLGSEEPVLGEDFLELVDVGTLKTVREVEPFGVFIGDVDSTRAANASIDDDELAVVSKIESQTTHEESYGQERGGLAPCCNEGREETTVDVLAANNVVKHADFHAFSNFLDE